jgi:hypothetical protein
MILVHSLGAGLTSELDDLTRKLCELAANQEILMNPDSSLETRLYTETYFTVNGNEEDLGQFYGRHVASVGSYWRYTDVAPSLSVMTFGLVLEPDDDGIDHQYPRIDVTAHDAPVDHNSFSMGSTPVSYDGLYTFFVRFTNVNDRAYELSFEFPDSSLIKDNTSDFSIPARSFAIGWALHSLQSGEIQVHVVSHPVNQHLTRSVWGSITKGLHKAKKWVKKASKSVTVVANAMSTGLQVASLFDLVPSPISSAVSLFSDAATTFSDITSGKSFSTIVEDLSVNAIDALGFAEPEIGILFSKASAVNTLAKVANIPRSSVPRFR